VYKRQKLRNAKAAAVERYLSSIEGRHFAVSNMVAEIAASYYELVALDNQLAIIEQNIGIQSDALRIVKIEKEAAKVTQLAINRFEAQLLNTQNLQYAVRQRIVETENRIRFLTATRDVVVKRNADAFSLVSPDSLAAGVPSQLLQNRPDVRQMEYELAASRLDVRSARANFYPAVRIVGGAGLSAFNPTYIFRPESFIFNLGGDLLAPLVNKNAIQATYNTASAKQVQAVFKYEQTLLNAFLEVSTVLSGYQNARKSFETKQKEVDILTQSINISNNLFRFAKADYLEILLTQREALDSRMELIEIKLKQTQAKVELYRALGGGWK
jgi:multidrug efflux system outer membrane protein